MFKIVLLEPEIPQNTGNIGRLAVALGAELVLVGSLGFDLDEKKLRRAGMDYWSKLRLSLISLDEFYSSIDEHTAFISTKGSIFYNKLDNNISQIVFGNESSGFPKIIYDKYSDKLYRIPMIKGTRSINLATSVGIVSYHLAYINGFNGLV